MRYVLFLLSCFPLLGQTTFRTELGNFNNIQKLPEYIDNSKVYMLSSYDRKGKNDDGFSGKYSYIRKEGEDEFVIADLKGAGVVQRIWTPTPNETARILFYFDGEKTPRIDKKFIDLFIANEFPFQAPLTGNAIGGYYSYVPIPYQKSLKIVYKGKGLRFHQVQYKQFTNKEKVTSFPKSFSNLDKQAFEKAAKVWEDFGALDNTFKNVKTVEKEVTIQSGEKIEVFQLTKGGRITSIQFVANSELKDISSRLVLQAKWDDEPKLAINAPFTTFFGYAYGKPSMESMLIGVKGKEHYSRVPMPFDNKASLALEYLKSNKKQNPLSFKVRIQYSQEKRSKNEGKLYTSWNRNQKLKEKVPFTLLEQTGKGHHIGTILMGQNIQNRLETNTTWFFEGDDVTTIDGETNLIGTGSEDYFNGGWYGVPNRWNSGLSLPVHGCLGYSMALARTGGYRFYTSDKVNFNKDYKLTIEHGPVNNNRPVDYESLSFYYGDSVPLHNVKPTVANTELPISPDKMPIVLGQFGIQSLTYPPKPVTINYRKNKKKWVYEFEPVGTNLLTKFTFDLPIEGRYKLYVSYYKSPKSSEMKFYQLQQPISDWISIHAPTEEFVKLQEVGIVQFKNGKASVTVETKGEKGKRNFILEKFVLEKIKE